MSYLKSILAGVLFALVSLADSTTFTGALTVETSWQHRKTIGASSLMERVPEILSWEHTDGTNAYQMTDLVTLTGTIGAHITNTVNVASVKNSFGDTVNFSRVTFLAIQCASNNQSKVTLGGAVAQPFFAPFGAATDTAKCTPGGLVMFVAPSTNGYLVGTSTNLCVSNDSGTTNATYYLYIGGVQ